jgi:hypothetical protein
MGSEPDASARPEQDSVVLASFASRSAAEHMLGSLGRAFRKKARKGGTTAFVVSGNKDGSLKITESRVLSAGDFLAVVIRFGMMIGLGFTGTFAALKGVRTGAHTARERQGHVGSDEQRAHELLAEAGPHAALALIRCKDDETRQEVAARASERAAGYTWAGPLTVFLSALEPGSKHDWVRAALGEPTSKR